MDTRCPPVIWRFSFDWLESAALHQFITASLHHHFCYNSVAFRPASKRLLQLPAWFASTVLYTTYIMGKGGDAVDEENIILCCAACCCNCGIYNDCDCAGCSGKVCTVQTRHACVWFLWSKSSHAGIILQTNTLSSYNLRLLDWTLLFQPGHVSQVRCSSVALLLLWTVDWVRWMLCLQHSVPTL